MSFIPCWKDSAGNRFFVLAENHVFSTAEEAQAFVIGNFLFYVPFGWAPDGLVEIALEDGRGSVAHVPAKGPYNFDLAVIGGPAFDSAEGVEA